MRSQRKSDAPENVVPLDELRRLARARPRSGREAAAKASALRALERLTRTGRAALPPMPDGWHPGPPEFVELDAGDTVERRERWWGAWLLERGR
jgi:hypothetical protein